MSDRLNLKSLDKYLVSKTLVNGTFKVKLAYDLETQRKVSAKICKTVQRKAALQNEASVLNQLNHANIPNIIRIIDFIENDEPCCERPQFEEPESPTQFKPYRYRAALITEFTSNDSLFDFIFYNGAFDEKLSRTYLKQLLSTLHQLHKLGYCHRNLNLENLLLDSDFNLKLCGFEYAQKFSDPSKDFMTSKVGNEAYMAPEMHLGKGYSGVKVDIFSCGIILFLMIFGKPPFFKANHKDPFYKYFVSGKPEKFWQIYEEKMNDGAEYNQDLKKLISSFLAFEPDDRPDLDRILQFDWLNGEVYNESELKEVMRLQKLHMELVAKKQKTA